VRLSELPWQRPKRELLLLALVAIASLSIVYPVGAQDVSRMCLTRAAAQGELRADACLAGAVDYAGYRGHLYSDKAPGVSFLALPAAELVGLRPPSEWRHERDLRLWATRIATGGAALLLCAFLLGRVAEGLTPGAGGVTIIAYALGTEAGALAVDNFGHVQAGALAFSAFVLAWGRRPLLAGLLAGAAMIVEYEAGLIALLLGAYVALAGWRALVRYGLGFIPAALALAAYDWAAFGSPLHLSYRYVSQGFAAQQASGFFGIHAPSGHGIHLLLLGDRGLLFASPFLLVAAVGLVLLCRRAPAEAALCIMAVLAFFALNAGYFDSYGGDSPGPRLFAPALAFLAIGLPFAYARARVLTTLLVTASVVASTSIALTWPAAVNSVGYSGSVWQRLEELVRHGTKAPLATWAQQTVLPVRPFGAFLLVLASALAALTVAVVPLGGSWRRGNPDGVGPTDDERRADVSYVAEWSLTAEPNQDQR
jgi:hypothetical protein